MIFRGVLLSFVRKIEQEEQRATIHDIGINDDVPSNDETTTTPSNDVEAAGGVAAAEEQANLVQATSAQQIGVENGEANTGLHSTTMRHDRARKESIKRML